MDDLVQWLREQLDEDERVARAATERQPYDQWDAVGDDREGETARTFWSVVHIASMERTPAARDLATFIAAQDPARVLREVDAKRRLLDLHHVVGGWEGEDGNGLGHGCEECGHSMEYSGQGGWCETVRVLALPYADRPGYHPEWRP
ncbi:DUF6221 family protein [Streptomyces sp. 796.1]|uniref:DUF6221 family protein n=1 Tax=Streptomyces sp. 796.1 TaxID=3163029 RepID=UPI0039C9B80F